jgi:hypothetical protein
MPAYPDWSAIRACEKEAARIRQRMTALGCEPPTARTILSTCPNEDSKLMLRQLRDELRCLPLDRFGTELRAALDDVASNELLDRLARAGAPESFRIAAVTPLRVVRLLKELVHEIEEERPTWQ